MNKNFLYASVGALLLVFIIVPVALKKGTVIAQDSGYAKSKGPETAALRLVEYSDFQCPSCQKVQPVIKDILARHEGKIQLVFKHFPLTRAHQHAAIAHQSAECAAEQGQFWEFHDKLYSEQAVWSALPDPLGTFLGYAKDSGVDLDRFGACLQNPETSKRIQEDVRSGDAAGIRSTPTFFLNGKMIVGTKTFQATIEQMIQEELSRK